MEPYEYNVTYAGRINDENFHIIHSKSWNAYTEEDEYSVNIIWENSNLETKKVWEEPIKKLFSKRLDEALFKVR
jgi:hypothetical protein